MIFEFLLNLLFYSPDTFRVLFCSCNDFHGLLSYLYDFQILIGSHDYLQWPFCFNDDFQAKLYSGKYLLVNFYSRCTLQASFYSCNMFWMQSYSHVAFWWVPNVFWAFFTPLIYFECNFTQCHIFNAIWLGGRACFVFRTMFWNMDLKQSSNDCFTSQ